MGFSEYRFIEINTNKNNIFFKTFNKFSNVYSNDIASRNIKVNINFHDDDKFLLELIGYDGTCKYKTDTFDHAIIKHIFKLIDDMPMSRINSIHNNSSHNGGSKINYKKKYKKYKLKYSGIKYVIDNF